MGRAPSWTSKPLRRTLRRARRQPCTCSEPTQSMPRVRSMSTAHRINVRAAAWPRRRNPSRCHRQVDQKLHFARARKSCRSTCPRVDTYP
jgi:hypothetical protein